MRQPAPTIVARAGRAVVLAAASVLCLACPKKAAVWVANGSTVEQLVLRISDVRGGEHPTWVSMVRVDRCDRAPDDTTAIMWLVSPDPGAQEARAVTYGVAPVGWRSSYGPRPLTPGCYRVNTSSTGRTVFDVAPGGRVTERVEPAPPAR